MQKDFTQTTDAEAKALLNQEIAKLRAENEELNRLLTVAKNALRSNESFDQFLNRHEWCRTAEFNG